MKKIIILFAILIFCISGFSQTASSPSKLNTYNSKQNIHQVKTEKSIYPANKKIATTRSKNKQWENRNKNSKTTQPKTEAKNTKHPIRIPDKKVEIKYHTKKSIYLKNK